MRLIKTVATLVSAAALAVIPSGARAQSAEILRFDNFTPHELRSATLIVGEAQTIDIVATGADDKYPNHTLITSIGNNFNIVGGEGNGWRGNAWILDASTREPVWELRTADTDRAGKGIRSFDGSVRLRPGTYEVYYASYSAYHTETNEYGGSKIETRYYDDGVSEQFRLVLRGSARVDRGVRPPAAADAVASIMNVPTGETKTIGLNVSRPTRVDVYAQGEAREDGSFDYGWIINADSRERVWSLSYGNSVAAGGARKNRAARETITLPAGRYAVAYTTDESHDQADWNESPPLDPARWGLMLRVNADDRANITTFEYNPVPPNAIVSIMRVGDSETRTEGFTLDKPMDVRIVALGEATSDDMDDYGWIINAKTHRRVWSMKYDDTQHAGGDRKNRLSTDVVRLDAGSYVVNYRSDASHSYEGWNAGPPMDGEMWGITVAAVNAGDRSAVRAYQEPPEDEPLAKIVKIGDNARKRATFAMDSEGDVRVYAIGEGSGNRMVDGGWIEERNTGKVVWEMTYRMTEHAGGAAKNRMFDGIVHLPAGEYVLRYDSDDSHSFDDWNDSAPEDPAHWGITVYRAPKGGRW